MNFRRWRIQLATGLFALLAVPLGANSFSLTATHFNGTVAYSPVGGAANLIGISNPMITSLLGGPALNYNSAALISFNFSLTPSYPTPLDIQSSPNQAWKWSLHLHDFELPTLFGGIPLPDVQVSHTASYNQVLAGAMWGQTQISQALGGQFGWGWGINWTSATTGVGYLAVAANLDPNWMPLGGRVPLYGSFSDCRGTIDASVEPVPEPLTMLMFGSGLAGLGVVRFRRKKTTVS